MFYCQIVDRKNLAYVLYALRGLEQSVAMWRLGPANLFDRTHPSGEGRGLQWGQRTFQGLKPPPFHPLVCLAF